MNSLKFQNYKFESTYYKSSVCNKTNRVYIPLFTDNNTDVTILVKKNDYVFKGSLIARRKGNPKIPVFSSVSGKVVGFEEHTIYDGSKVKCIVIENDYKERLEKGYNIIEDLGKLDKHNFINLLNRSGILEVDDSFYRYLMYNVDKRIRTLIVTISDFDMYCNVGLEIIKENCEEILETIDVLLEINNISECILVLKKSHKELLGIINDHIGMYLKIKVVIVPDVYFFSDRKKLVKKLTGVTYNHSIMESGVIMSSVSTIFSIYHMLRYNKPLIETMVTFWNDNTLIKHNFLLKNGTLVKDLNFILNKTFDGDILVNGTIEANDFFEDLIITPKLTSIYINKINGQNKNNK